MIKFGAIALTVTMFTTSCKKEDREEKTTSENKSENVQSEEAKSSNNPENYDYFEFILPQSLTEITLIKNEDLLDYDLIDSDNIEVNVVDDLYLSIDIGNNQYVDGFIKIFYNTSEGKITNIKASTNFQDEAILNEETLSDLDLEGEVDILINDLIEKAAPEARCNLDCQNSYRENVYYCYGDPQCVSTEWGMYKDCNRGCLLQSIGNWFRGLFK